jgi:hypothetical protein
MASKYLDGSMIPRAVTRRCDQRGEPRGDAGSEAATVELRGRKYVVPVVNLSRSGAMLTLSLIPHIGETISIHLVGRSPVVGTVCWVRDGKIGITFATPME